MSKDIPRTLEILRHQSPKWLHVALVHPGVFDPHGGAECGSLYTLSWASMTFKLWSPLVPFIWRSTFLMTALTAEAQV